MKKGDTVYWVECETSSDCVVYPSWTSIVNGEIVWINPNEEIIHVYQKSIKRIVTLLSIKGCLFFDMDSLIEAMILNLRGLKQ